MVGDTGARRSYRQVADLVIALIAGQRLAPGDRLPSERELAEKLCVSRPSVREALIALEVEGRVVIRMGSGIYIAEPGLPTAAAVYGDGPFELLTARQVLESAIAEEAARQSCSALIEALDANLREMAFATTDRPKAISVDASFHVAIAKGTGNPLLVSLTSETFARRLSPLFNRLAAYFEGPHTWRSVLAEHTAIRDAIVAADPAAAREAMRHHLIQSQERLSKTFSDALAEEGTET